MDFKHVKLSLMLLAGLLVSSYAFFVRAQENSQTTNNIFLDSDQDGLSDAEEKLYNTDPRNPETGHCGYTDGVLVRSGYEPLTCQKIIAPAAASAAPKTETQSDKPNLTKTVAQKVVSLTKTSDASDQQVTLDQVQGIVNDTLNQTFNADELPQISADQIKIKKQNYSGLSATDAAKKKKADITNYVAAVYYILASNSPQPIHASDTFNGLANSLTAQITSAITQQDPGQLQDLSDYGQKVLDQLKNVEVPQDMVDTHLKALQFATYALSLKDSLQPNPDDPMGQIAQYSKLEAFLQALMDFSSQVTSQLSAAGVQLDSSLINQIKSLGVEVPQIDLSNTDNATPSSSGTAPAVTTGTTAPAAAANSSAQ